MQGIFRVSSLYHDEIDCIPTTACRKFKHFQAARKLLLEVSKQL